MKRNIYKIVIIILFLDVTIISIFDNKKYINNDFISNVDNISSYSNKSYYMILEIPSINLRKELYNLNDKQNNVNKNIEVLNYDTPIKEKGNIILASHSGNSKISFFTDLDKLRINDELIIYYDNNKYIYNYKYKYYIHKNGVANIYRNKNKKTLTLITCDENDQTKQLVFISEFKKAS